MSNDKPTVKDLLDQLASSAIAKSAADLSAELKEAGVEPEAQVNTLRSMVATSVARYRRSMIYELPEAVPEAPSEMRELLQRLIDIPGIAKDEMVGAFREKEELTDNDLRILTENLLRLIKRHGE